jgi:hypothetical protein
MDAREPAHEVARVNMAGGVGGGDNKICPQEAKERKGGPGVVGVSPSPWAN